MKKFKVGETVLVEAVIDDTYENNADYMVRLKPYDSQSFMVHDHQVYPFPSTKTYEDGLNDAKNLGDIRMQGLPLCSTHDCRHNEKGHCHGINSDMLENGTSFLSAALCKLTRYPFSVRQKIQWEQFEFQERQRSNEHHI